MPDNVLTITCEELDSEGRDTDGEPLARSVSVGVGVVFRITLCSNPSTGFRWEEPVIAGSADVSLVERQAASGSGSVAGEPGDETFTFQAISSSTATIDFAYSRPWEGGETGAWRARVSVDAR